jgi:hypothetical protein
VIWELIIFEPEFTSFFLFLSRQKKKRKKNELLDNISERERVAWAGSWLLGMPSFPPPRDNERRQEREIRLDHQQESLCLL